MGTFREKHARVLDKMRTKEAVLVTVTFSTSGVHDPETETFGASTQRSVQAYALQVKGDAEEYASLGLTKISPFTIILVPLTYGESVGVGWGFVWAGKRRTVQKSNPIQPDGVVILTRVVVA